MDLSKINVHPVLKRLVRTIEKGDHLFQQGQMGSTMFIILHGVVDLVGEKEGEEHVVGSFGAGHFLGEKAIVKDAPYQRYLSARAQTDVLVLELGMNEMNSLAKEAPAIMGQLLRHAFEVAIERLDRSNYLVRILRSSDNYERLLQYLIFYSRIFGKKRPNGSEFSLKPEGIFFYIDMHIEDIKVALEVLVRGKVLMLVSPDTYVLADEQALLQYLPNLTQLCEAA